MASYCMTTILGNTTRDVELRFTPNNKPVASFGMACNRKWRDDAGQDREEVAFFDLVAFGRQAEVLNEHVKKGQLLFVTARPKTESWEDKQGGGKRSKLSVVVEQLHFLPRRDSD